MEDATHEKALGIVNEAQQQLGSTVRAIMNALKDGKITPLEGIMLGNKGMSFAMFIIGLTQDLDPATRADVLWVLEHGEWVLPA